MRRCGPGRRSSLSKSSVGDTHRDRVSRCQFPPSREHRDLGLVRSATTRLGKSFRIGSSSPSSTWSNSQTTTSPRLALNVSSNLGLCGTALGGVVSRIRFELRGLGLTAASQVASRPSQRCAALIGSGSLHTVGISATTIRKARSQCGSSCSPWIGTPQRPPAASSRFPRWIAQTRRLVEMYRSLTESRRWLLREELRTLLRSLSRVILIGFELTVADLELEFAGEADELEWLPVRMPDGTTADRSRFLQVVHPSEYRLRTSVARLLESVQDSTTRHLDPPIAVESVKGLVQYLRTHDWPLRDSLSLAAESLDLSSPQPAWPAVRALSASLESIVAGWIGQSKLHKAIEHGFPGDGIKVLPRLTFRRPSRSTQKTSLRNWNAIVSGSSNRRLKEPRYRARAPTLRWHSCVGAGPLTSRTVRRSPAVSWS